MDNIFNVDTYEGRPIEQIDEHRFSVRLRRGVKGKYALKLAFQRYLDGWRIMVDVTAHVLMDKTENRWESSLVARVEATEEVRTFWQKIHEQDADRRRKIKEKELADITKAIDWGSGKAKPDPESDSEQDEQESQ